MKRTPLKRGKPVRRISEKRRSELPERDAVRQKVLARDRVCRGYGLTPVTCRRTPSEVHELGRGAYRRSCWLNEDLCIALCGPCHRWVTNNPRPAQAMQLALPGWKIERILHGQ